MQLNPYLYFNGNCEAAFKFYEQRLGGKIETIMTHAGTPAEAGVPPEWRDKVLHARMAGGGPLVSGAGGKWKNIDADPKDLLGDTIWNAHRPIRHPVDDQLRVERGRSVSAERPDIFFRERALQHFAIGNDVGGFALGKHVRVVAAQDAIAKLEDRSAQRGHAGFNDELIVIAGRGFVTTVHFNDGNEAVVFHFHRFVLEAELAQQLHPANFKPDKKICIVDDAHLVGFRVAHTNCGGIDHFSLMPGFLFRFCGQVDFLSMLSSPRSEP